MSASLEPRRARSATAVEAAGTELPAVPLRFRRTRRRSTSSSRRSRREVPRIDILVNNAGTIARAPAAEHADELWDRVLEVNLTAQFVLAREIGRRECSSAGSGKIVFIASLLSFQGGVTVPGYAASKGGHRAADEGARERVGRRTASTSTPSRPATSRPTTRRRCGKTPTRAPADPRADPAGRWGEPEDLAGAVVFLASPASDYVHGVVLPVDGGWLAR